MEGVGENFVGVFTTDADMRVRSWDFALERFTGMPANGVVGKSLVELVPDISSRGLLGRFERSMNEGTTEILSAALHGRLIPCESPISSRFFTEMQQHVTITPLIEAGAISGLMVSVEDVTARLERKMELTANLSDPDRSVRLDAARDISLGEGPLPAELIDPIIQALGDVDWRVRRRLSEAMSRRATSDAIHGLLGALKEKHLDFGTVNSALQILRSTDIATVDILIGFLGSADADLRMHAALALGEQSDSSVVPALLQALSDTDVNVRYHVIESLGKQKAVAALEALLAIAEERDFFLSFAALEAIGEIGPNGHEGRIASFLGDDVLWEPAARALSGGEPTQTIRYLVELLNTKPAAAGVVAEILGNCVVEHSGEPVPAQLARSGITSELSAEGIENFLVEFENRDGAEIAKLFSFAGLVRDIRVRVALADCMDDPNLIEQATAALLEHGLDAADTLAAKLLSDDDQVVCRAALSLGQIGAQSAVDSLIGVVDRGGDCASAASRALGMIGGQNALSVLVELARSDDPERRRVGIKGFSELNSEAAIPQLTELLSHPDPRVRETVIETCGKLRALDCADLIITLSQDPDERVRKAAVKNLRATAGDGSVQHAIRALQDSAPAVRATAAAALSEYKSSDIGPFLGEALDDADPWTRYFAIRGLAKIQDVNFAERVRRIAQTDSAEHVRVAADDLLRELGSASVPGA